MPRCQFFIFPKSKASPPCQKLGARVIGKAAKRHANPPGPGSAAAGEGDPRTLTLPEGARDRWKRLPACGMGCRRQVVLKEGVTARSFNDKCGNTGANSRGARLKFAFRISTEKVGINVELPSRDLVLT